MAGPFDNRPLPTLRISPLGLVDFIDQKLCSVQYTRFDEAIHMIHDLGQGCLLGKSDIRSAFRLLPVSSLDFDQLGFMFEGKFYFDKAMPFGCSLACKTWELFASFLEFCVARHSTFGSLLHYLDDFLFGGGKEYQSLCGNNVCLSQKNGIAGCTNCSGKDRGAHNACVLPRS